MNTEDAMRKGKHEIDDRSTDAASAATRTMRAGAGIRVLVLDRSARFQQVVQELAHDRGIHQVEQRRRLSDTPPSHCTLACVAAYRTAGDWRPALRSVRHHSPTALIVVRLGSAGRSIIESAYELGASAVVPPSQFAHVVSAALDISLLRRCPEAPPQTRTHSATRAHSLAAAEASTVARALKHSIGNRSQAAALLQIGRRRLFRLIKKYNLE